MRIVELLDFNNRLVWRARRYTRLMTKYGAKTLYYAQLSNSAITQLQTADKEILMASFREDIENFTGFIINGQFNGCEDGIDYGDERANE